MRNIVIVYYQGPDYHARPTLPEKAFASYDEAQRWISEQPGWGGKGIATDWHTRSIPLYDSADETPEFAEIVKQRKRESDPDWQRYVELHKKFGGKAP